MLVRAPCARVGACAFGWLGQMFGGPESLGLAPARHGDPRGVACRMSPPRALRVGASPWFVLLARSAAMLEGFEPLGFAHARLGDCAAWAVVRVLAAASLA